MRDSRSRLLAVLTVAVMTLASGTIQAFASLCQPADKAVQESCCPTQDQGVQTEDCQMGGCDCTIDSSPVQQEDSPALVPGKAPTWDVPVNAEAQRLPQIESGPVKSDVINTHRERGPPKQPDTSCNGLRAPPSQRA